MVDNCGNPKLFRISNQTLRIIDADVQLMHIIAKSKQKEKTQFMYLCTYMPKRPSHRFITNIFADETVERNKVFHADLQRI